MHGFIGTEEATEEGQEDGGRVYRAEYVFISCVAMFTFYRFCLKGAGGGADNSCKSILISGTLIIWDYRNNSMQPGRNCWQ